MDEKTKGAWIIHHSKKIASVEDVATEYEQLGFAGKCGILLNSLSASDYMEISNERLEALAKAANITVRMELPAVLTELERQRLIDRGKSGVAILGSTTVETLKRTSTIFDESEPQSYEQAAIHIAEATSNLPLGEKDASEVISDTYEIASQSTDRLLNQFSSIGFVDSESISNEKLFFNGNLFRKGEMQKINGVLSSLNSNEEKQVNDVTSLLHVRGCIPYKTVQDMLGKVLLQKLVSIGFFDVNTIHNESGRYLFVTRPAAFAKYTHSTVDDAFDLAKALVTSLTYGISYSATSRGRIKMLDKLMKRLIAGDLVGPATAIGHDYKVLEIKGVVEVQPAEGGMFYMKLLKRDVGEIALKVITDGEASSESVLSIPGVDASAYSGPEYNRAIVRKKQAQTSKDSIAVWLQGIRTGVLK